MKKIGKSICLVFALTLIAIMAVINAKPVAAASKGVYLEASTLYCVPDPGSKGAGDVQVYSLRLNNDTQYKPHWSVGNDKIVKIVEQSDDGIEFMVLKSGTTKISCTVDGKTYKCTVKAGKNYKSENLCKKIKVSSVKKVNANTFSAKISNDNAVPVSFHFSFEGIDKYGDKTGYYYDTIVVLPAKSSQTVYLNEYEKNLSQYKTISKFAVTSIRTATAVENANYAGKLVFNIDMGKITDNSIGTVSSKAKIGLNVRYVVLVKNAAGKCVSSIHGTGAVLEAGEKNHVIEASFVEEKVSGDGYTYVPAVYYLEPYL